MSLLANDPRVVSWDAGMDSATVGLGSRSECPQGATGTEGSSKDLENFEELIEDEG